MVSHLPSNTAVRNQWHERIEDYTPDGAFGRILIAILLGPLGVLSLLYSVGVVVSFGLLWLPLALLLAAAGLGATILSVMMLWPVYLSLIGNVESAKAYPQADTIPLSEESRDDAIAVVKRQYAAGNISEKEFERRLDNLLSTDAEFDLQSGTSHRNERDTIRETD